MQVAVELPIDHNPFRTVNLKEDEWGGKVGGGLLSDSTCHSWYIIYLSKA